MNVANHSQGFALSAADLFYQCFYVIDELKEKNSKERNAYCQYALREELNNYFENEAEEANCDDINNAIFLVLQSVAEFYLRSDNNAFLSTVSILKERIDNNKSQQMDTLFRHGFKCVDANEVQTFICEYLKSEESISDKIHNLIKGLMNDESHCDNNVTTVMPSTIRIANRKKSSVVLILNAMYKLGWFVDVNMETLTNRDKALNEILKTAFGETKNTAISQILKPSGNTNNESRVNGIIEEFSESMEEIMEELRKTAK